MWEQNSRTSVMNHVSYAKKIRRSALAKLRAETDPERARQQQTYMKSEMPFFGLSVPRCRRIAHEVLREYPPPNAQVWVTSILPLWREATHREERYIAIELFLHKNFANWLVPDQLPVVEEMVVTGTWWDYVDALAARGMGTMIANDPIQTKRILCK